MHRDESSSFRQAAPNWSAWLHVFLVLGVLFALIACRNEKKQANEAPPLALTSANEVTARTVDLVAEAANGTSVKHQPGEATLAPTRTKLVATSATVRTAPAGEEAVTIVKRGLEATQVARDRDYYLVVFDDPKDTSLKLAGWVYRDAIEQSEGADAGSADARVKLVCKAGEVHMQTDRDFCAPGCRDDGDCRKIGGVCDGEGRAITVRGTPGIAHYCVANGGR